MIDSEAEFLSSCEPVNQASGVLPKWWDGHKIASPIPNWKDERVDGAQANPKSSKTNSIGS